VLSRKDTTPVDQAPGTGPTEAKTSTRAETPFEVIPAVDVLEGRAVRLREGVREQIAIEGGDPAQLAARFAGEGARRLHLVDLDGAFAGRPSAGLLARIASVAVHVPIQIGGGYRSLADVETALASGADRVMIGTAALSPTFLSTAADRFGDHLVVAVDARDGRVAVEGWTRAADVSARELADRCAAAGIRRLLVTGTRRDGTLAGPDLELLADVLPFGLATLAAGGTASLDDLDALRALGCEGAVVGSALWRGAFTLAEALAAVSTRKASP
jgi:phosphoribosylformimino-5-aminoimidazole carboxamide ribotide isomerase